MSTLLTEPDCVLNYLLGKNKNWNKDSNAGALIICLQKIRKKPGIEENQENQTYSGGSWQTNKSLYLHIAFVFGGY